MYYAFMKILYAVYFMGLVYLVIMKISQVAFASRMKLKNRVKAMSSMLVLSLVWPLTMFSENGRNRLNIKTRGK